MTEKLLIGTLSLNTTKSIIKFLRLRWHPDKSQGQEEICHRVFVYLQQCISRLENCQQLQEETDDTENVNEAQQNFASSRYASFFSRMNDRFYTYHDMYEQEEFPSAFSHRESAREPKPSPSEARIWKRQAESDLQDAKISMENYSMSDQQGIPAANWICYRCHQVIIRKHINMHVRSYMCTLQVYKMVCYQLSHVMRKPDIDAVWTDMTQTDLPSYKH